jgi:hypothetical protein
MQLVQEWNSRQTNAEFCVSINEIEKLATQKVLFENNQFLITNEHDFLFILKSFYSLRSFFLQSLSFF